MGTSLRLFIFAYQEESLQVYPSDVGLPFGGPDYSPYFALEIHYNNQEQISGLRDKSGMRFKFTDQLREHEAGITEIGIDYSNR